MIVNGKGLLAARPLEPMFDQKHKAHGVSYGLSEAGYDIRIRESVVLHPFKRFALASSLEAFDMPTNFVGLVKDKSTWARRQLSVFNTVVEPGWKGESLTLELVYFGWGILRIPAGAGIAQVLFFETQHAAQYAGKYQNAPARPVAAIMEKG